jgi:hypothetical protein
MLTQRFKAAAPENVRRLLSHKDQTRLTLEDAPIQAVTDEKEAANLDQDIAAFRQQQKQQTQAPQQNFNNWGNRSRGQGFSRPNFNNHQNVNQPRTNAG